MYNFGVELSVKVWENMKYGYAIDLGTGILFNSNESVYKLIKGSHGFGKK